MSRVCVNGVAQLLAQPEEAGPEDMLILVRQWMVLAGLVGKPRELLVRRSITHKVSGCGEGGPKCTFVKAKQGGLQCCGTRA